nr:MFS transporter [Alicyclobacillus sp. SO9]
MVEFAAVSSSFSLFLQKSFHSWQASLASWAVIAFVAAVVWRLLAHIPQQKQYQTPSGVNTKLPWTNPKAWLITISFGLMAVLFYSFTAWLPQIIQGMGYTKSYAANALTLFVAVQIPVSLILSVVLRKIPSRRLWLIVESLFELCGLLLLVFHRHPLVASGLIGIGAGGLFPLNLLLPIDITSDHHEAAAWSAKAQSVGYVIGAAGPIFLGWIHAVSNSFSSAVFALIAVVLFMMVVQVAATSQLKLSHTKVLAKNRRHLRKAGRI